MHSTSRIEHVGRSLRSELASADRGLQVTCGGPSMEPTVCVGDKLTVRQRHRIRVGDVVLFETRSGQALVLHRVVARVPRSPYFVHMGDAHIAARAGISRTDRVIGTADLPRQPPSLRAFAAGARALFRSGVRQILGLSTEPLRRR